MGLRKQISKLLSCFWPRRCKLMEEIAGDDDDDNDNLVVTRVFQGESVADENSNEKVVHHDPEVGSGVLLSDKPRGVNMGHVDIGEGVAERVTGHREKKIRWAESCLTEKHMLKMLAAATEQKERVEDELVIEDLE